ncbi:MAG: hypothetical protein ABS78_15590 [Phenylobacterium sp. SCN 70-31]|nr:MAG: hypothetical protein ABS78_15590 [Phenylobacterium sp. SCN 70-31]
MRADVDFKPVETRGKRTPEALQDLADGQNATHECIHALAKKVDEIAGSVKTLTDLFSKGPPAVKASMGWMEHGKLALTILGAASGIVIFYRFGAAIAAAAHQFLMGTAI